MHDNRNTTRRQVRRPRRQRDWAKLEERARLALERNRRKIENGAA